MTGGGRLYRLELRNGALCGSCGKMFADGRLLDFAHMDGGKKLHGTIHGRSIDPSSIKTLSKTIEEVKLCDLLCANCHALESAVAENSYPTDRDNETSVERLRRLQFVNAEKLKRGGCVDCGVRVDETIPNFPMFDFDHRPGTEKKDKISRLVRDRYSSSTIQREMALCDLRCKCCHRLATLTRNAFPN